MSSLADLQRAPDAAPPVPTATLPLAVERVRTFDTPEFRGMSFLEVEVKSALNKVSGMPFPWSINPYRGCSHACSYCLGGETPVLMADGRTRPLAEVEVGDAVVGTAVRHGRRRYTATRVLDHWSTVKPGFRVRLADGTELIASGDHRFLTGSGWRYVTAGPAGDRPALAVGDRLVGTGRFTAPPKPTPEYQRGYLCGIVRSDRAVSGAALDRMLAYLEDLGAPIAETIAEPEAPDDGWCKGLLAGVFDARGRTAGGELRMAPPAALAGHVAAALDRFGFAHGRSPARGGTTARLDGGLGERLRFLHLTDPAAASGDVIDGAVAQAADDLTVVAVEALGLDLTLFDVTTGTGDFVADGVVSHNCFARPTHAYLNLSPLGDFERTVVVKTNLVEVLRRELARPSWRGEHVAMGTNTDPYQRCEGRYRLMPGIIAALAQGLTPFSILTKGTLITRDLDALVAAAERVPVSAALSIGIWDTDLWRDAEPGTPSPAARLAAVRTLNDAGIPTGVMLAPILPGLGDDPDHLAALVDAAVAAGATHVTPIVLHLRPGVREVFWPWLTERHPELVERYRWLYRRSSATREYREEIEDFVREQRKAAWRRHGRPDPPRARQGRWDGPAAPQTEVVTGHPVLGGGDAPRAGAQLSLLDAAGGPVR